MQSRTAGDEQKTSRRQLMIPITSMMVC